MKIIALLRKLLGLSVVTKSRCGFLLALVLIITIGLREAIRNIGVLSRNEDIVCIAVGTAGFLSWLVGRVMETMRPAPAPVSAEPGEPEVVEDPLGFLRSLKYWGVIFLCSAGVLSALAIYRRPPVVVARAREVPVVHLTVTNVVTITNETKEVPPVPFPLLQLQGVVVNGRRSSALINGRVLCLGEAFSNAVLVAVDSQHAAMVLEGQTNLLALRK